MFGPFHSKQEGLVEYQILVVIKFGLDTIGSCLHCQVTCEWLDTTLFFSQMNQVLNVKILIYLTYVLSIINWGPITSSQMITKACQNSNYPVIWEVKFSAITTVFVFV